jgi:hypothetical protein
MRTFKAGLVVLGALVLVNIIGALAFLAAGKLALHLDPSANESHFSGFIVAIIGVAVAVGSAFPILSRGVPWMAARLERVWPERPPEHPIS